MSLEENIQQLRDSLAVTSAMTLRHETRVKEHQEWLEDNELAFAKHRALMLEFDQKMTQLAAAQLLTEEKLQGLVDALRRGSNGH
jgi:oligoendopeptidase F